MAARHMAQWLLEYELLTMLANMRRVLILVVNIDKCSFKTTRCRRLTVGNIGSHFVLRDHQVVGDRLLR